MNGFHIHPAPCPVALLWHEGLTESPHVDWMIATDPAGHGSLVTFRLPKRLDALEEGQALAIERIGDHRPRYLHFEGSLSGNRGSVRRIASGSVRLREGPGRGTGIEVSWKTGPASGHQQALLLQEGPGGAWEVHCRGWNPDRCFESCKTTPARV